VTAHGIPFKLKVKVSARGVGRVIRRPKWALIAALAALAAIGVMLWLFNWNLLVYIFTQSGLPLVQKIAFVAQGYGSLVTNFDSLAAAMILMLGLLVGLNTALVAYVIAGKGRQSTSQGGKGGLALAAGVFGAGCAACGTGILGPVLAVAGASGSIVLARTVGIAANAMALALVLYSIYGLGMQAATIVARDQLS
jgi:hypothetical protein